MKQLSVAVVELLTPEKCNPSTRDPTSEVIFFLASRKLIRINECDECDECDESQGGWKMLEVSHIESIAREAAVWIL